MEYYNSYINTCLLTRKNGEKSQKLNGDHTPKTKLEFKTGQFYKAGLDSDGDFTKDLNPVDNIDGLNSNAYIKLEANQYIVGLKYYRYVVTRG